MIARSASSRDRVRLSTLGDRRPGLRTRLGRIWRPAVYQDGLKRHGYFEGWYFKIVNGSETHAAAIIPGISLDPSGNTSHSFVQLIRTGGATAYWEYPVSDFRFDPRRFEIEVGPNRFSLAGIELALEGGAGRVNGALKFGTQTPWPVRPLSPGIMGWYRFVPFMEAYHGVLSLDHSVEGSLGIDGESVDFSEGRGYAEKDWGRSFPSAWVWAQSNHFESPGTSVTVSIARIPWLGGSFIGYIVGLLHDGTLYEFTTYNGARVPYFDLTDGRTTMLLTRKGLELHLTIDGAHPGTLRSPVMGAMSGTVWESLDASIAVKLSRADTVLFEGTGTHAGVELMDKDSVLAAGLST